MISPQQRRDQIIYNEMAINNVLHVIPTFMRPPYSSCNGECQVLMEQLGYHVTSFDIDTEDTDLQWQRSDAHKQTLTETSPAETDIWSSPMIFKPKRQTYLPSTCSKGFKLLDSKQ